MKIYVMSDLHLEFGTMDVPEGGDVLVLAGDVGLAFQFEKYVPWLVVACNNFKRVVMVMGNHEHYHGNFKHSFDQIADLLDHLPNFHLLEDDDLIIDDVLFIGATLWSDIDPIYEHHIQNGMNDYRIIKHGDRLLSTLDTREAHYKSIRYIEDRLKINKASENPIERVVVITHHNPTLRVAEQYRGNIFNSAYGTNYEKEIEAFGPDLWVFGHTHVSADFKVGNTRLVCNPRGYAYHDLNPEFDINMMVKI